jgi:hypothetical protein
VRAPLLQLARSRVGVRRAYRVVTFMVCWHIARRELDVDELTLDAYAEWWRVPERTAYREQALFREAFPEEATPDRLLDRALSSWDGRGGVPGLGRVQVVA